ncbi:hypothetical protein EKK58_05345 [Candidatus Dependentiae bacterium]|nr:MAG: hypothetical protein EKK58_05345 [Candidatus Dependentiae bacterium]
MAKTAGTGATWEGSIDGRMYRVNIVDGVVVTESRADKYDDWRKFTQSGYGSNIREQVLEQALLSRCLPKRVTKKTNATKIRRSTGEPSRLSAEQLESFMALWERAIELNGELSRERMEEERTANWGRDASIQTRFNARIILRRLTKCVDAQTEAGAEFVRQANALRDSL